MWQALQLHAHVYIHTHITHACKHIHTQGRNKGEGKRLEKERLSHSCLVKSSIVQHHCRYTASSGKTSLNANDWNFFPSLDSSTFDPASSSFFSSSVTYVFHLLLWYHNYLPWLITLLYPSCHLAAFSKYPGSDFPLVLFSRPTRSRVFCLAVMAPPFLPSLSNLLAALLVPRPSVFLLTCVHFFSTVLLLFSHVPSPPGSSQWCL